MAFIILFLQQFARAVACGWSTSLILAPNPILTHQYNLDNTTRGKADLIVGSERPNSLTSPSMFLPMCESRNIGYIWFSTYGNILSKLVTGNKCVCGPFQAAASLADPLDLTIEGVKVGFGDFKWKQPRRINDMHFLFKTQGGFESAFDAHTTTKRAML